MSTKKSPFDNPEPVPARTQETVFGVPQDNASANTGVNLNEAFGSIPTHRTIGHTATPIRSGSQTIVVPAGHEVIVFRKEFAPALLTELDELIASIQNLKPVASQTDVEAQNTVLKNASRFMTRFETERKAMGLPLKSVTDELLQIQKNTLAAILQLVTDKNTEIVNFQKQQAKIAAEKAAEIQKQKDAEILAAQQENKRKQDILNLISQFETNTLNAIASATINNIDERSAMFGNFKVKPETYMEYMPQVEQLQRDLTFKFMYRKEELMQVAELEKTNKLQADQLKLQQDQKAEADKQAAITRDAQQRNEASEQLQSDVANTQMQAEFKTSSMPVQKNVMRKWTFDPEQVDMAALPDIYKTFDAAKIQADITAGARSIPGVVIEERISNVKR